MNPNTPLEKVHSAQSFEDKYNFAMFNPSASCDTFSVNVQEASIENQYLYKGDQLNTVDITLLTGGTGVLDISFSPEYNA